MALKLITPPAAEPLALSDIEAQVRGDLFDESALVEGYIKAIRQRAELELRRALITQTWDLVLDAFPTPTARNPFAALEIPLPPLQSITSIQYLATAGQFVTLAPEDYTVDTDSTPGKVMPAYGKTWPVTLDYPGAVRVRFVAGYGPIIPEEPDPDVTYPDNVPQCIKNWMKLNVASLYENRESLVIGSGGVIELTTLADSLLDPERWEVRV